MVECEYKNLSALDTWKLVLIDTWWNVNSSYKQSLKGGNFVLIDTWWNVNKTFAKIFDELKAF